MIAKKTQNKRGRPKKTQNKRGRPSKYISEIHDPLVYQLVRENKTTDDIAENYLRIPRATFYDWIKSYPSFGESYKAGKEAKIDNVEENLYRRAAGMIIKETTKTVVKGKKGEEIGKAEVKEVTKQLPPDVAAMCFILKTQRRDKWAETSNFNLNMQAEDSLSKSINELIEKK